MIAVVGRRGVEAQERVDLVLVEDAHGIAVVTGLVAGFVVGHGLPFGHQGILVDLSLFLVSG